MEKKYMKYSVYTLFLALLIVISACDSKNSTEPEEKQYTNMKVLVTDEAGRPISNGVLYTVPQTAEVTTDSEGWATFENIVVRDYSLSLRRSGFPTYTITVTPDPENSGEVLFTVDSEEPNASITAPTSGKFMSVENIVFTGLGSDLEDGELSGDSLVWRSSIDGEIGRGSEIRPTSMTIGEHNITLTAYDSDQKKDEKTIVVTISDYAPDSYFPFFRNAEWDFEHIEPRFSFRNENGSLELWEIFSLHVDILDGNVRTSTISYRVTTGGRVKNYDYKISDHIFLENNNVYVSKTVEEIKIWDGNPYGDPDEELMLTTEYSPAFLIVPSVNDIPENYSETKSYALSVLWTYNDRIFGDQEKTEHYSRDALLTTGTKETVTAYYKDFDAIPVYLSMDGMIRNWYLSQGVGLVYLEYNSFVEDLPPKAHLVDTNLSVNAAKGLSAAKPSQSLMTGSFGGRTLNIDNVPAEDSLERFEALIDVFRSTAIR